jgi:hypothetical protein
MKVGRVFLSGCMVYVIVAACSAIDPAGQRGATSWQGDGGRGDGGTASMASGQGGVDGSGGLGGRPDVGSGGRGGSASNVGSGGSGGSILDPVPTASADPISGTRLKARYWQGADGSKSYIDGAWYDSELDINCAAAIAADGTFRCLPTPYDGTASEWVQVGFFAFEDSLCTQPIADLRPHTSRQRPMHPPANARFVDRRAFFAQGLP